MPLALTGAGCIVRAESGGVARYAPALAGRISRCCMLLRPGSERVPGGLGEVMVGFGLSLPAAFRVLAMIT